MDKIVVMLRIFFLMLCLLPVAMADNSSNLSGSPVKKSANNQLVDLPSSDIIFYELFKQKPNDDVVILQDKSEARFWFGHVFSVENISYYVGFVAIQEFDRESNDLKMGVMDQARIAQVTFMNDQGKWKVISKNADLKFSFGARGEPPYLDEEKSTETFFFKNNLLLLVPTSILAPQGIHQEFFEVFNFDLSTKQWVYLGGDIKTAQDNSADCEDNSEDSEGGGLCIKYSGTVSYSSKLVNNYPVITVTREGTDFCDDYTKVCPIHDHNEYVFQSDQSGKGKYTLTSAQ